MKNWAYVFLIAGVALALALTVNATEGPQGHAPAYNGSGWSWTCYDTNGHETDENGENRVTCSANEKVDTVEEVVEVPEVQETPVVVQEKPTPKPVINSPRPTPTPIVVDRTPKKKSGSPSKKRNRKEVFEHECGIDRDQAPWDLDKRSKGEIERYCEWFRTQPECPIS